MAASVALVEAAAAQEFEVQHLEVDGEALPAISLNCTAGVVYDDGVFNDAYSIGDGDPNDSTMVIKFDLPPGTTSIDQICACFTRTSSGPASMVFDVAIYNDNGPGGQPGTALGLLDGTANSIPIFPSNQFYAVNTSGAGIVLPDPSVYVGVRWPGGSILLCGDRSVGTPQRTNFGSANSGGTWTNLTSLFPTSPPRALGVRVDPATGAATCTPTPTRICLNNNRFAVEGTFEFPSGTTGPSRWWS